MARSRCIGDGDHHQQEQRAASLRAVTGITGNGIAGSDWLRDQTRQFCVTRVSGTLKVDGKAVATKRMEKTRPMILHRDESFDVGSDTLTGVNDADYRPPFALTAKLNKLAIRLDRPQLSPADTQKLQAAMQEKAKRD